MPKALSVLAFWLVVVEVEIRPSFDARFLNAPPPSPQVFVVVVNAPDVPRRLEVAPVLTVQLDGSAVPIVSKLCVYEVPVKLS